ncbi:MAG TPA: sn-glycerol-3-phosphate ABC transporter ATP-binding protein UgpC [Nannocystaceae bacterium]|nr:sn-glycerol-3-phosphate ABC transporter ATP-binding protein UgpC [Nannocystaceae bacterium]
MVDVRLRALGKRFGETVVLSGVDAHFADGTFVVLVGKSGCGKSTLLRMIAGLEEVSEGAIELGGRDVTRLAPRDRDVAMVFQSYALYPHMTVRDNLAFGLRLRGEDRATIDARIAEAARKLEIEHLLDRHPRALSGGQRQRVAMGRAIVRRPALFLFDEPLSNLDPSLRNQVRVDIRRLHDEQKATSIYVTHDQVEAMTLADVLVVLDNGRVQQVGAPLEIYRRPANRFVAGFLGSPAMNFLAANLQMHDGARAVVFGDGARVPVGDRFAALPAAREVVLGIRPHDVRIDPAGTLPFDAELVETLGPHVHVHGEIGGDPFVVALDTSRAPERGERLTLAVDDLHLFDPATGIAL